MPSADRLLDALNSFQKALTWPEAQQRIQALMKRGLQREVDFESRWPAVFGTLLETQSPEAIRRNAELAKPLVRIKGT